MIARRLMLRTVSAATYYGLLALVILAALGPIVWVIVSSFKTNPQILSSAGALPNPVTLDGYRNVFTQVHLQKALWTTFVYAAGGTLGALISGFLAAYPTSRLDFPGRHALTVAFSVALAVPLVIPPDASLGAVAELARTEQACCMFFRFALTVDTRGAALEVTSTPEASDIVRSTFGAASCAIAAVASAFSESAQPPASRAAPARSSLCSVVSARPAWPAPCSSGRSVS